MLLYIIISVNKQLMKVLRVTAYKNTKEKNLEHFKIRISKFLVKHY